MKSQRPGRPLVLIYNNVSFSKYIDLGRRATNGCESHWYTISFGSGELKSRTSLPHNIFSFEVEDKLLSVTNTLLGYLMNYSIRG